MRKISLPVKGGMLNEVRYFRRRCNIRLNLLLGIPFRRGYLLVGCFSEEFFYDAHQIAIAVWCTWLRENVSNS
jgi:hypothetical protein